MRRKILLFFLLFIPFIVKADDVSIKSIELIENNTAIETIEEPTINGLNINFKLNFSKLNESVKYKVIVTNNSKKDYEIANETKFSDKEYIKYDLAYTNDAKVLKANSNQELIITITYNKEVPFESFVNGVYTDNNDLALELTNNQTNPYTKVGLPLIIMIAIASLSFIFIIVMSIKKHSLAMLLIALLLIPFTIYALERITINVKAFVKIESQEDTFELRLLGCSHAANGKYTIRYNKHMSMSEFYESSYFEALDDDIKVDLSRNRYPYAYNSDVKTCIDNNQHNPGDTTAYFTCASGNELNIDYENTPIINDTNGVYIIIPAC